MNYVSFGKKYVDEARQYFEHRVIRLVIGAGLVVAIGVGGYFWYQRSTNNRQAQAVEAFEEAMQAYYNALAAQLDFGRKGEKPAWDEVELAFDAAYQQNRHAAFAPYFLVYQAQALAAQQKYTEAIAVLDQALNKLDKENKFYDLFRLVRASILIDAGDQAGQSLLQALADDAKNPYQEMAKYYLAQYYLSLGTKADQDGQGKDQGNQALSLFQDLAANELVVDGQPTWAALAKEYV